MLENNKVFDFQKILLEIDEIQKQISVLKVKTDIYSHRDALKKLHEIGDFYGVEVLKNEHEQNCQKLNDEIAELTVYRNNLKYIMISEVMPIIINVLNNYKGKRLGTKTEEKLRSEIREKIGYGVTIYRQKVVIYVPNHQFGDNTVIVYTRLNQEENTFYDIITDNKVNEIEIDMFQMPKHSLIISDVSNYIDERKKELYNISVEKKMLEEKMEKYNEKCISGFKRFRIERERMELIG